MDAFDFLGSARGVLVKIKKKNENMNFSILFSLPRTLAPALPPSMPPTLPTWQSSSWSSPQWWQGYSSWQQGKNSTF